ncbi:unnamed protein product [Pylaiella littoralis]
MAEGNTGSSSSSSSAAALKPEALSSTPAPEFSGDTTDDVDDADGFEDAEGSTNYSSTAAAAATSTSSPVTNNRSSLTAMGLSAIASASSSSSPAAAAAAAAAAVGLSAIEEAQQSFTCPQGFKPYKISSEDKARSPMYTFGTRVCSTDSADSNVHRGAIKGLFYCMASKTCRERAVCVKITSKNTTPATTHLSSVHHIKSTRGGGREVQEKKMSKLSASESALSATLCRDDPVRYMALSYVRTHVLRLFMPLAIYDDEAAALFFQLVGHKSPYTQELLPEMRAQQVKRMVVEMYDAVKNVQRRRLKAQKETSPLPWLHVSLDLWTARASGAKYIGVRGNWMTEDFRIESHLLAVKEFKPGKNVSAERASAVTRLWTWQVLNENGAEPGDVMGVVCDGGASDIYCAFNNVDGVMFEWCIAHQLNHAIIDGFGLSAAPWKSNNPEARAVIFNVKKDVECMKKSEPAKAGFDGMLEEKPESLPKGGLSQHATHRWVSASKALERYLVSRTDFATTGRQLAVTNDNELLELYSLMKAVALVIESTQGTSAPSAPGGMQRMLGLVRELEEGRPLCLHDPSHHFQPADRRVEPGAERGRVTKQHAELTSVAQATRVKLRQAIMDRFASERFGQEHNRASHLFDMVSALNPCTRQLVYVNHLAPSAEVAAAVKEKIWSKLRSLAELIIDASRLSGKAVAQGEPPAKRPKISAPNPETDQSGFDFFDGAPEDMGGNGGTVQRPSLELAQEAIARYRTAQLPSEFAKLSDGESLASFWRGHGRKKFPVVASVARAVLAAPASSAVLERDFSEYGELANRQQCASLPPEYAEILTFLRRTRDSIPMDVPSLSPGAVDAAIPVRLKDPNKMAEVADIGSGIVEDLPVRGVEGAIADIFSF